MSVEFISQNDQPADPALCALARRSIESVARCDGFEYPFLICVVFTDDAGIWELNRRMRGVDRSTDVLSFPMVRFASLDKAQYAPKKRDRDVQTGEVYLGDIVVSLEHAKAQAQAYGHSMQRETGYLCAHGAAHLLGYDHETPEEKTVMRALEERALEQIDLKRIVQHD